MAIIQPFFAPTQDTSLPVFASFWNGFMQERSSMNLFLMRQFLDKASPEFLDAHIEQTNNRIIELEKLRNDMAKTSKIEGNKLLMEVMKLDLKRKSRRSGYRGGVSSKDLLKFENDLNKTIIANSDPAKFSANQQKQQGVISGINSGMSQNKNAFTDDFMLAVTKGQNISGKTEVGELGNNYKKWNQGELADKVIGPLVDRALGEDQWKKADQATRSIMTATVMENVMTDISERQTGNTGAGLGSFGPQSGLKGQAWFPRGANDTRNDNTAMAHRKLSRANQLLRSSIGESTIKNADAESDSLSGFIDEDGQGYYDDSATLSKKAKSSAEDFKAYRQNATEIDYATQQKRFANIQANYPTLILLSERKRNLDIAKSKFAKTAPDGGTKHYESVETLRKAQSQYDQVERMVKGTWTAGSKKTPFDKRFASIIDASLAVSPALYRQWKKLNYTPEDPNIEGLEKSLREQKDLLTGLRVRREKMYEDAIRGPERFFKGFKSNYLLETPFKKPSRAEELSQKFIEKSQRAMGTPTGQSSRNFPGLESGREYQLNTGMWVGVTKDEQPFFKEGANQPPKIITADNKDYDYFTKVLTRLNRQVASLGK